MSTNSKVGRSPGGGKEGRGRGTDAELLRCCLADVAIVREGDFQSDLYGEAGGEGPCEHAAAEPVGHGARFSDGARAKKGQNGEFRDKAARPPPPASGGGAHAFSIAFRSVEFEQFRLAFSWEG